MDKDKGEKSQIINIRNERRGITIDPVDTKRIIRESYKQHYDHKYDTLKEMDKFLKTINYQDRLKIKYITTIKQIDIIVTTLFKKRCLVQMVSLANLKNTLRRNNANLKHFSPRK